MDSKTLRALLGGVGIAVLAIVCFAAGAAWHAYTTRSAGSAKLDNASAPAPAAVVPAAAKTETAVQVQINNRPLTPAQIEMLRSTYGAAPPPGQYWYDARSGLYGYWGREAAGFIRPGHDLGPLPASASAGNSGVFINGRELNAVEIAYAQRMFGAVYRGRYWMESNGNMGMEGNPQPLVNVFLLLRQAQSGGGGDGGYRWRDSGTVAGSEGNCTWMSVPGAPTYSTSGC